MPRRPSALRPAIAFALTFVALTAVATGWMDQRERRRTQLATSDLLHQLDLAEQLVRGELAMVEQDARFLADQALQRDEGVVSLRPRADLEPLWEDLLARRETYLHATLLDATGVEVARVNAAGTQTERVPADRLQDKSHRYYQTALERTPEGAAYISPLDLNMERGVIEEPPVPTFRAAVPLFDGHRRIGGLVVNHRAGGLLQRIDAMRGELAAVRGDGTWVGGVPPAQRWGALRGVAGLPDEDPALWEQVLAGKAPGWAIVWVPALPTDDEPASFSLALLARLPRPEPTWRGALTVSPLALLGALVVALLVRTQGIARRQREEHLEVQAEAAARLRRVSLALLDAAESERRAVARDLHDDLGQLGTVATLQLKRARALTVPAERDAALDMAEDALNRALSAMRRLAGQLRPQILDDLGLIEAVRQTAVDFERRADVTVELEVRGSVEPPTPIADHVFRILQAALANVAKHASASEVRVALSLGEDTVEVQVADDGVGFDPAAVPPGRLGLASMRERADLLGGTFGILSTPGEGTTITIRLPVTPPEAP